MLTKSKTNTYRCKIINSNTMGDSNLRIVIITKSKIQLSKIYPKNNKVKLSKQCNTKMFQNDEARNEYKQQLKDKINKMMAIDKNGKVYVIVHRGIQNPTWKNTAPPKEPVLTWNDIT